MKAFAKSWAAAIRVAATFLMAALPIGRSIIIQFRPASEWEVVEIASVPDELASRPTTANDSVPRKREGG